MSGTKVIAVFDIGKTHKKLLLFNEKYKIILQKERRFDTTMDEDGFECDDIEEIETWIKSSLEKVIGDEQYEIVAVNFSTYGASLMFLDENGERLTPVYNYLKEIPENIQNTLFDRYGGKAEFCRKTASPPLGLCLNSGVQILWLKQYHSEIYKKAKSILHFPQYLSFLFTGQVVSEPTSVGCHTFLWDFDNNKYHRWLKDENISLPAPNINHFAVKTEFAGKQFSIGIGIHDSSASLLTYLKTIRQKFILVSTGTWCINMNPFNHQPLTMEQLKQDCLANLTIDQKPVKSSRLFMGHIHDVNVSRLCDYFNEEEDCFKNISINEGLLKNLLTTDKPDKIFFSSGVPSGYVDESVNLSQFKDFSDAYHRLLFDLTQLNGASINLISAPDDGVTSLYVSGGFARNIIFVRLLASFFPEKEVYTSEIDNASALGAALVMQGDAEQPSLDMDLNIQKWDSLI
jgi:sugar (pentulose or hexulose) kinase